MTRRPPAVTASVALVLAAALLWGSSRVTWVSATASDDLRGVRTTDLAGGSWAGATVPLALALLAAVAAVAAVRGWARRVVAGLVLLVAVGAAVPAVTLLVGGAQERQAATLLDPPVPAATVTTAVSVPGPLLALLAAVVAVAGGVVLLRARPAGGGLSSRYATPAARRDAARATTRTAPTLPEGDPAAAALTERVLWDALDAGEDPTAGPPGAGGPGRDAGHARDTLDPDDGSADERGQRGGPGSR